MLKRGLFLLFLAVAATLTTSVPAQQPYARPGYGSQVLPLDRVLPEVRRGRAGRFFDAEGPFPDADGGYHYRIKWLTPEGRVIWLDTDARSGRVLGVARGDWREQGPPAFGGGGYVPRGRYPGPNGPPPPNRGHGQFGGGWHNGGHGHRGG